ncbi:hypothetical protein [uncultured Porphyromonas sp.]|uniref:hypothetical protein n=1 Tax=uncultured Porphyromonas sp. TaxID=159274 RepID=UPI0026159E9A|nr:hypothetical protein [uncultured Porphyromonas sp.]
MAQDQTTPTPDEVEQQTSPQTPEGPGIGSSDTTPASEEDTSNAPQAEPNDIATPDDGDRKAGKPKSKAGKAKDILAPEAPNHEPEETPKGEPEEVTALASIAREVLRSHQLPIVWLTTDGTAFPSYSDARNYARSLKIDQVDYFFAPGLTEEERETLLPAHLRKQQH